MYGLAVNLIVRVSGHPWIINEIIFLDELHITYSVTLSTPHCSYTNWGQRPYCL